MPSQPQSQDINYPTLVLAFLNPATGELVSTAKMELLPGSSLLRLTVNQDIPAGSVACMPLGQGSIAQVQSVAQQPAQSFSSFDHK